MFQAPTLDTQEFSRFVVLNATPFVDAQGDERCRARAQVLEACAALLGEGAAAVLAGMPSVLGKAFAHMGWAWNGFYALRSDGCLHLSYACGPPVCSRLDASGGALTSGMCFDSLALNQTLAAYDTKRWPGYVSCDASSHLGTSAGIVVPLRNAAGKPIGCWDLDCTQGIEAGDVRFMDVLLSTLARCVEFEPSNFGKGF